MKVMSFNTQHCLNYLEQRIDYEIMAKTILEQSADIVGLNEMYDKDSIYGEQTRKLSELTGMRHYYFAKACSLDDDGAYGNGFLSKYPIKSAQTIIIPDPDPHAYDGYYETRCLMKVILENDVTVLVTHFGLNPDEHESAKETILKNISDKKCILMGDFNITPDNPIISSIREKIHDTSIGFCENSPSWPSDNPEIKIDYIFASSDLEVISADVLPITSSDHRPHIAELKIK